MPVRIGDCAGDGVAGREGAEGQLVVGFEIELLTARHPRACVTFTEEMALTAAQEIAFDPHLDREICRAEVVGGRTGHLDGIVNAIEGQRLPIGRLAGDPDGPIEQRASVAVA